MANQFNIGDLVVLRPRPALPGVQQDSRVGTICDFGYSADSYRVLFEGESVSDLCFENFLRPAPPGSVGPQCRK